MSNLEFEKQVIFRTEEFIKATFSGEGSGHDWWHICRVRNLAIKIAESEGGNRFIIEMAALLHDLDDWKLNGNENLLKTKQWLIKTKIPEQEFKLILDIIGQISFKGAGLNEKPKLIEAQIVQDADRLDAIGAIGIARAFTYGGHKGRTIYLPDIKPQNHKDFESYKNSGSPTLNHFQEKL